MLYFSDQSDYFIQNFLQFRSDYPCLGYKLDFWNPYSLCFSSSLGSLTNTTCSETKKSFKKGVGREPNDGRLKQQRILNRFYPLKGDRGKRWERLGARGGYPLGGSTRASSFPVCPPSINLSINHILNLAKAFLGGDLFW
jgi:hypothetical protein